MPFTLEPLVFDAPAGLRAETVGVPISPLDEVRVLRPGTEVEVAEGETGELAARGPYTIRGYLAAPDRDDRCGCFRRNAADFAPDKFVQHQVADDQNALARSAVEDGGENAWAVRSGEAHPFHPARGGDENVDLAVGEKGVVRDGREIARESLLLV